MSVELDWEAIDGENIVRAQVPGGWLLREVLHERAELFGEYLDVSVGLVFIPDPEHILGSVALPIAHDGPTADEAMREGQLDSPEELAKAGE